MRCGELLEEFEAEQELRRLQMSGIESIGQAFGAQQSTGPLNGKYIGEITQANFRDQGF